MPEIKETELPLHPEHGANPSLGMCFWCGKGDGRVLLLGLNGGEKAKEYTLAGYDACDKCKELMAKGIMLMDARRDVPWQEDQPPMDTQGGREIYPSGKWAVVTEDCIRDIFQGEIVEKIIAEGRSFLDHEAWEKLGFDKIGEADGSPS